MNNLPITNSYEIKTSRTEQKVPVVNNVHLHSIYSPSKEAETFVNANIESLKNNKEALILGLGFGYHVNFAVEKLIEFHGDNYRIVVIEPNVQVYQDCLSLGLMRNKNVLIYSGQTAKELFSDLNLIHFLLNKPTMLAHPASFNLYQKYFKDILTFEAPVSNIEINQFIKNSSIKDYIANLDPMQTFESFLFEDLPQKSRFSKIDFLAMALVEMTKSSQKLNRGEKR